MPDLTITAQKFKDDTSRSFHTRSAALKLVTTTLDGYSRDHRTVPDVIDAVRDWFENHPREFAKRDQKSNGLCTALVNELGLFGLKSPTLRESAFEVEMVSANVDSRPTTAAKYLNCGIVDFMLDEFERMKSHAAVVLIDMQSTSFGQERYSGGSVGEQQAAVLDAANQLKLDIFEVRIVRKPSEFKYGATDHPTISSLASHFPTDERLVKLDKPYFSSFQGTGFALELKNRNILATVVMGYDANTCVANTIFGKMPETEATAKGPKAIPYIPGLLERGVRVITARGILASDRITLTAEYGVRV